MRTPGKTALQALVLAALILLCGAALADSDPVWPKNGSKVQSNGKLELDASYTKDGYFMAAVKKKNKRRLKLRVTKGKETLTYDLNGNGEYEVFPLQLGSGTYSVQLYENISGKKYSQEGKITLNVKLSREEAPFLVPSQYVNYTKKSEAVAEAERQCEGKSDKAKVEIISNFMKTRFVYDFIKAMKVEAGELPDIDNSYRQKKGVCQDLSAIMVCMLRTQGIPAKLMIGYADKNYHAWVSVLIGGKEVRFDPTAALSAISKVKKYTLERFY